MKPILPVVALVSLAVQASAQNVPVRRSVSSIETLFVASAGTVSDSTLGYGGDQSGVGIDAYLQLPSSFILKAGLKAYSDVNAYTLGIGFAIPVGADRLTLGLEGTSLDIKQFSHNSHAALRVAYDHHFSSVIRVGAGVAHFLNSSGIGEDSTAPYLTIGYNFSKSFVLELTLSSEDAILGSPDSGSSANLAVRITL